MKILLLGSGGREHALAWKIAQSPLCSELVIAPGNAGTAQCGTNINLSDSDIDGVKKYVLDNQIDMIVVGPEQALVNGIYDAIKNDPQCADKIVIGPSKAGAQLEGSKSYSKTFMQEFNIPTAAYRSFNKNELNNAIAFLYTLQPPYVLKADGLAAGKGVIITSDKNEAINELNLMLGGEKFGEAGEHVVIEEFLSGIELSVFVLTDGKDYVLLPSAKDYKRIGEGDTGLNTGGMGSISPVPFADTEFMEKVKKRIIEPTLHGIQVRNLNYHGFIFFGLINVKGNPYVIEYNVRMGDPETESVMPRIESDLVELFLHVDKETVKDARISISPKTATSVMLVSGGYPQKYPKGKIITGIDNIEDGIVFHAGTKIDEQGHLVTNGGRVLTTTTLGNSIEEALSISNRNAERIQFEGKYYRHDIGKDLL